MGAKHGEFVTDEICDRFCVLGNAEQATAKLKELEAIGVDQFNIYLMTHGQEETSPPTAPTSSRSSRNRCQTRCLTPRRARCGQGSRESCGLRPLTSDPSY